MPKHRRGWCQGFKILTSLIFEIHTREESIQYPLYGPVCTPEKELDFLESNVYAILLDIHELHCDIVILI